MLTLSVRSSEPRLDEMIDVLTAYPYSDRVGGGHDFATIKATINSFRALLCRLR